MNGDERYRLLEDDKIRKVDSEGKVDPNGLEFNIIETLENGYYVYITQQDSSQPSISYFIHKKYFV